jgi:acylphosphatase
VRYLVEGRVQGVFYRASALEHAQKLGLSGWVRNLPDGRVEVLARGEASGLDQLSAWLWQGPAGARVSAVTVEPSHEDPPAGFAVR